MVTPSHNAILNIIYHLGPGQSNTYDEYVRLMDVQSRLLQQIVSSLQCMGHLIEILSIRTI